jgi:hypothetical protein
MIVAVVVNGGGEETQVVRVVHDHAIRAEVVGEVVGGH